MALSAPSRRRSGQWGDTSGFVGVRVEGAAEIDAALKDSRKAILREQRKANRLVAKKAEGWARADAAATGGGKKGRRSQQAASANAIKGRGTAASARLQVVPGARTPFAAVAFWGQMKRTGWYAKRKYRVSVNPTPQSKRWIGTAWGPAVQAGDRSAGPYVIADTIIDHRTEIDTIYFDAHAGVVARALEGKST